MFQNINTANFLQASRHEPRNRAVVDVVAARDFTERFLAGSDALLCLLPLVRGELGFAAELHAVGDGSGASFASACAD